MMAITIFFAMLGMLSPASRGALLTASIFVYEFMGLVAGYFAGRLYKTLKGKVRDTGVTDKGYYCSLYLGQTRREL